MNIYSTPDPIKRDKKLTPNTSNKRRRFVQTNMNKFTGNGRQKLWISRIYHFLYYMVRKEMLINYFFLYITGPTSFSKILGMLGSIHQAKIQRNDLTILIYFCFSHVQLNILLYFVMKTFFFIIIFVCFLLFSINYQDKYINKLKI